MTESKEVKTLKANKLFDILLSMLAESWKNQQTMMIAIRDFAELFKGMDFTVEQGNKFIKIYETLTLKNVTWDEFLKEYRHLMETTPPTVEELINETTND